MEHSFAHRIPARLVIAAHGKFRRRHVSRLLTLITAVAVAGLALPAWPAGAAPGSPTPTLKQLLAKAAQLSTQIDDLSQQYDALRIQYDEAQAQVKIAKLAVINDERILAADEAAIAQIAAAGYMTGGINPALQLLQGSNPQAMLNQASILTQLQQENGAKIKLVATAKADAQRARITAVQEAKQAAALAAAMQRKVAKIQAKVNTLNSAAYSQAMAIYQQTGKYPAIPVNGNSAEIEALRAALTRVGAPYEWGGAGPSAFDCSGLVVWAYAQIGISLPHYTGDLWNSGVHVSRAQLQPGDLIFFFPDIGHVGFYMGAGMMLDAPTWGQPVQVQPVYWGSYVGAVRIA